MARRVDRERIRMAMMTGSVAAIRGLLRNDTQGHLERLRADWPEMADRIVEVTGLIDWG